LSRNPDILGLWRLRDRLFVFRLRVIGCSETYIASSEFDAMYGSDALGILQGEQGEPLLALQSLVERLRQTIEVAEAAAIAAARRH